MATEIGKGVIPIGFDGAKVESDARASILPGLNRVAGDVALLFVGKKLFDFGKSGLEDLKQAQQVTAQTEAQIRATGGAAGVTAKDVDELGQSMLNLAGFDDEAARSAANVLLRFGAIKGADTFKRVETDAADLAITMGTDLPAAAQTLGTILQTPENAARKLRPIIGSLTDSQLASIKAFEAQGDAAGAQGVVLGLLESKISGTAAAYGQTLPGQVAIAQASLKEAKEQLVAGLAPGLELVSRLVVGLSHGFEQLPGPVQSVAGGVLLLGGGFVVLARPVSDVLRVLDRFRTTSQDTVATTEALTAAQTANIAVTETSVAAMSAADEVALRRVVSNEAIEFSDAQVAGAMQARQDAELQALVSNTALITADEELAVAQTAAAETAADLALLEGGASVAAEGATVATGGLLATLGPFALAGGLAAGALTLMSVAGGDTTKAAQALDGALGKLDTDLTALSQGGTKTVTTDLKSFLNTLVQTGSGGDKYRDALNGLGVTTDQFAEVLGKGAQAAGEFITSLLFHGADKDMLRVLGELVGKTDEHARATLLADVATGRLTQSKLDETTATHLLASGDTDWIAVLNELAPLIAKTTAAQDAQVVTQQDQLDSTRNLFEAQQSFASAQKGLEQAQRGVADADRGVEAANQRLADSYQGVADAEERLTEAQDALTKAQQPADAETLGKAQLDLADAHFRVGDAQSAVTAAEAEAAKERKDGQHTAAEVADADRKVEEAKNDLQRALFAETDAEKALQEVQAKGTDQDAAVVAAKKAVEDAARGVETANRNVADALQGVTDAQQRVIDAQDAVNTAYLNEGQAAGALKQAQDNLYGGTLNVNTALLGQITALQGIDALIAPGSSERQNLDDYIKNLFVLAGIFQTTGSASTGFGGSYNPDRDLPGRASGGPLAPRQLFHGGEQGSEWAYIPPGDRIYQAPDVPSMILTDRQARATFAGTGSDRTKGKSLTVEPGGIVVHHTGPESTASAIAFELQIQADRLVGIG